MMQIMKILSNYQQGTRNAKVYKTQNGEWGVIVYDAQNDYNDFETFPSEEDAECFAEDWVLKNVSF